MFDLESAIRHCEEVAEENEHDAKEYNRLAKLETYPSRKECESSYKRCCKCAAEHRQLAEWLKLLKRILDSGDCNDCAMLHRQCRYVPRWGEQVRYNCPFYSKEEESEDGFTKWAKSVADSYRNDKEESE